MKQEKDPEKTPEQQYTESLASISNQAKKTCRSVNYSLDILVENLEVKVQKIKVMSSQAVFAISEISLHTKAKLIAFGAGMFLTGVLVTAGLYTALIRKVVDSYFTKTIEKMAEAPVREAKKEAEKIIRNANIKADGMLKGASEYKNEEQK